VKKLFLLALFVPALALAISDMKWFDLSHWSASVLNDGRWGYDATQSPGVAGGSWPSPVKNFYVFGAGAWVGAIMDTTPPETLCTAFYNPNSGSGEGYPALCSYWRGGGDSLDRVYKHPGDWPPPAGKFPMAPQDPRSDMDLWCGFCDSNPANHISPGRPLGIDVFLTVFGYDDSLAQDFFFLKYELTNRSGNSIDDAYFGVVLDADIGDGTDDMTGLILDKLFHVGQDTFRIGNAGFACDNDNYENPSASWESGTPGAVAVMLLDSPDSLGLTAFKKFTIDIDPVTDAEQYLTLAGYDWRTGVYSPYDSSNDVAPGDKRMVLASGPFDIAPDSVLTFSYAVIGSPFGDSGQYWLDRDTTELALRCKWAREYFEQLTGVEETMNDGRGTMNVPATIIRNVLVLPAPRPRVSASPCLLDACGRKVLDLHAGPNDVSRLSPGVYFCRQTAGFASSVESQPQAVTKVIIAR
jgi:hypothetical protein